MGDDAVTLSIAQGALRGQRRTAAWGHQYCVFLGIPYAKPPVGELRFQPPLPADGWSGVRDASKEGNQAPQVMVLRNKFEGEEDCLYLNVITPWPSSGESSRLLPVLFVIHGGGLAMGSGNLSFIGPDYFIQHEIIIVTFNYRLNVLGFLSTGDSVVPGNMGFKDQVMALRWVKDNIAKFGGDPNNITLYGVSGGGWSCQALMLSPLCKGLFHRAIMQSGVAVGEGVCSRKIKDRSFQLAKDLGLNTGNSQELLDFLLKMPAKTLIEKAAEHLQEGLLFPFVGTVEPDEEGAFFPRHPLDILKSGDFPKVPVMITVSAFEGSTFLFNVPIPKYFDKFACNPGLLVPEDLPCIDALKDDVGRQIRDFYFGDKPVSIDSAKELLTVLGDTMFSYAAVRSAKLHASFGCPVYFYVYDKTDTVSASMMEKMGVKLPPSLKNNTDAGHGFGINLLWTMQEMFEIIHQESEESNMVKKMTTLISNFMKTGKPTLAAGQPLGVTWPPFTPQGAEYLRIVDEGFTVEKRPFREMVDFWDRLYERYGG